MFIKSLTLNELSCASLSCLFLSPDVPDLEAAAPSCSLFVHETCESSHYLSLSTSHPSLHYLRHAADKDF